MTIERKKYCWINKSNVFLILQLIYIQVIHAKYTSSLFNIRFTGETLDRIFMALKAQFNNFNYDLSQYSFTRTKKIKFQLF